MVANNIGLMTDNLYSGVMVLTQYCEMFAAGHVPGSVCTPHNCQYSHCTSCELSHPASKQVDYIENDCSQIQCLSACNSSRPVVCSLPSKKALLAKLRM